jgi:hypothetical protein
MLFNTIAAFEQSRYRAAPVSFDFGNILIDYGLAIDADLKSVATGSAYY